MDPGGYGQGAFGGAKASGATDPLTFLRRPIVCMRVCTLVRSYDSWVDFKRVTHVIFLFYSFSPLLFLAACPPQDGFSCKKWTWKCVSWIWNPVLAISPPWLGSWPFWPPSDFSLVNGKPLIPGIFYKTHSGFHFFTVSFSPLIKPLLKNIVTYFSKGSLSKCPPSRLANITSYSTWHSPVCGPSFISSPSCTCASHGAKRKRSNSALPAPTSSAQSSLPSSQFLPG